jgi:polyferredoxin
MAKKVQLNPFRVILQSVVFLLLAYLLVRPLIDKSYVADFEAYCPFGGIQAFSSFLVNNSLACSMTTTQIFMGFALLVGIFLVSKLFCSFICPIGSITELLSRLGRKLKVNIDIKGWPDRVLRVVKYSLLFVTFYFTVTSSELFCRTYDPYYASFSGFSSDVVVSYAIMALLIAIPGSFFIRQFWCKYFCPLGAVSNILSNSYVFASIIALYLILTLLFKLSISWLWLLGALTLAGVLLEVFKVKVKGFSLFKITRNAETCTNCKLCDKACPMAIKVSLTEKVKDVDCHLCGDCVASCPELNTLKIFASNKWEPSYREKKRATHLWIPSAIVIVLVVLGLAFAQRVHIPTISLMWGDTEQLDAAGIFEQEGLAGIKCFGSSMSFANQMKEIPGVLGVETYVGNHGVRVWYDKSILGEEDIKEAMFNPVKRVFSAPANDIEQVSVCEVAIDHFFDPADAGNLGIRFMQNRGILGMKTKFGEPVHAVIYYDESLINAGKIKSLIEARKVEWKDEDGDHIVNTNFKVAGFEDSGYCLLSEYLTEMYEEVSMTFNGYDRYNQEEIDTLTVPFPHGMNPELEGMPWYLLSHISNNRGVVSFKTSPTNHGFDIILEYIKNKTTVEQIIDMLNADELVVHLSDGSVQKIKNPYRFNK